MTVDAMTGEEYVGKESLSGRYTYHSSKDNIPLFVREGSAFGLVGRRFFFIYREGHWMITNQLYVFNERFSNKLGAFLRLETKGTFYA